MRSRCIGNPSGSNAGMGLVIAWQEYQFMSKHIFKGKPRFNLKRVQEAQVQTCCRTSGSNGCIHVVFGNPNGFNARMGLVIPCEVRLCCRTSELNECIRVVLGIGVDFMVEWDSLSHGCESNGCVRVVFGIPKASNARMGLVIVWEACQVMSKNILKGKQPLNLKRIQEAQVRTCCRTSESNGCVRVVLGIRVSLMLEWDS
ncbi:uncharacterized protein G2W53_009895 [Senna tora]|uniref:Uncharacterized protein n=1 Tax=Senna tora TaxID=362788 RepID=A0A835CAP3_9FABA|nr:uncharacterized protein G2W53_009895 [Senna tora]